MALHLDIKNGKLTIRPTDLYVAEIDAIWQYDTSEVKEQAQRMLRYVFGIAERREDLNPFAQLNWEARPAKVRRNIFGAEEHLCIPFEEKLMEAAIHAYELCNSTAETRAIEAYDLQIDEMTKLLSQSENRPKMTEYTTPNGEIKYSSNAKLINEMLLMIDKVSAAKENLVARMARSSSSTGKNRKGVELSASEKGLIGYNPVKESDLEDQEN
jgi:hypothetical protein